MSTWRTPCGCNSWAAESLPSKLLSQAPVARSLLSTLMRVAGWKGVLPLLTKRKKRGALPGERCCPSCCCPGLRESLKRTAAEPNSSALWPSAEKPIAIPHHSRRKCACMVRMSNRRGKATVCRDGTEDNGQSLHKRNDSELRSNDHSVDGAEPSALAESSSSRLQTSGSEVISNGLLPSLPFTSARQWRSAALAFLAMPAARPLLTVGPQRLALPFRMCFVAWGCGVTGGEGPSVRAAGPCQFESAPGIRGGMGGSPDESRRGPGGRAAVAVGRCCPEGGHAPGCPGRFSWGALLAGACLVFSTHPLLPHTVALNSIWLAEDVNRLPRKVYIYGML